MIGHEDCKVCHGEGVRESRGDISYAVTCDCTQCIACDHEFIAGEERIPDPDYENSWLCADCATEEYQQHRLHAVLRDLAMYGWVFVEATEDVLLAKVRESVSVHPARLTEMRVGNTVRLELESV